MTAFQLSWPQFLFRNRKEPNAPQLYADMTNYYLALMLLIWLGLAVFAPELLRIMATPSSIPRRRSSGGLVRARARRHGLDVQHRRAVLQEDAAAHGERDARARSSISLNFWLIPVRHDGRRVGHVLRLPGADVDHAHPVARRVPRAVQLPRMAGMLAAALGVYFASTMVETQSVVTSILLKIPLVMLFPVALLSAGLFDPKDVASALDPWSAASGGAPSPSVSPTAGPARPRRELFVKDDLHAPPVRPPAFARNAA